MKGDEVEVEAAASEVLAGSPKEKVGADEGASGILNGLGPVDVVEGPAAEVGAGVTVSSSVLFAKLVSFLLFEVEGRVLGSGCSG